MLFLDSQELKLFLHYMGLDTNNHCVDDAQHKNHACKQMAAANDIPNSFFFTFLKLFDYMLNNII